MKEIRPGKPDTVATAPKAEAPKKPSMLKNAFGCGALIIGGLLAGLIILILSITVVVPIVFAGILGGIGGGAKASKHVFEKTITAPDRYIAEPKMQPAGLPAVSVIPTSSSAPKTQAPRSTTKTNVSSKNPALKKLEARRQATKPQR